MRKYKAELLEAWERAKEKQQVRYSDWSDFVGDWEENTGSPYADDAQEESNS